MTLSVSEVETILKLEKEEALGVNSSTLAEERKTAIDYYLGDMDRDMPSADGRSGAVSSDVADTVEGLMPPLMEIFAAGEEVVRFEPVGLEDEPAAEQETDYVNHVFMQRNPGFLTLYSLIKDALLSKIGIVKVYWNKYEREERETYENQSDEAYIGLLMRPDVEIVSHDERTDDDGARLHDVVLVNKRSYACAKIDPVPPEEFGIKKTARTLRDATYVYHEPAGVTESDLIAQGYDEDQIKSLPGLDESKGKESTARDQSQGYSTAISASADKSMREVRVTEHYKVMDYQGDGKPMLYRVTTGGERFEILTRDGKPDIVPIDMMPFAAATPVIMTHRFFGRSVADLVLDIQRIKTALLRALLDNAYLANNQRIEVAQSHAHERTLDDLLVNRPGGVVRTAQPGGLLAIPNQPIGDFVFPLIEYVDSTREFRTGVTKQGQGIDANALQNQSATAVNQLFSAAQAKIKLIARVLAETGIRDLFSLLHATIRKNDTQANTVRLRNKWVQVDPRNWKTRDDMTINVGLGTGSRETQTIFLRGLLDVQEKIFMFPGQGLVKPKNVYNTLEKLIQLGGFKSVEPYFTDPEQNPQPPPPPDPKMLEVQAKQQAELAKMQADAAHQKMKTEADLQLEQQKFAFQSEMERVRFDFDKQLALIKAQLEERKANHDMQVKEHAAGLKAQESAQKVEQAKQPKASIEVKHAANEITGPLGEAISEFGKHMAKHQEHMAETHAKSMEALHAVVKQANAPKKIVRGKDGRVSHVETVQ